MPKTGDELTISVLRSELAQRTKERDELRALLQEATEDRDCFEHQHEEDPHVQAICECGANICPDAEPQCPLGRVDRALGHSEDGCWV